MNKRTALLLTILAILLSVFTFKFYISAKNELNNEYKRSEKILKTAEKIKKLQNYFKFKTPHFCIQKKDEIICKNLDKYKFYQFQKILKNAKIKELEIKKENNINAKIKIEQ
jgi:hypothetical protein